MMVVMQTGLYVIQHAHLLKQTDILERSRDTGLTYIDNLLSCYIFSIQQHFSGIWTIYSCKKVKHCGFPGAVGADQTIQLFFFNGNVKTVYRPEAAEGNPKILYV